MSGNFSAFLGMTALFGGLAFFVIYWAVRLGVSHALEERDVRRREAADEANGVEPDLER